MLSRPDDSLVPPIHKTLLGLSSINTPGLNDLPFLLFKHSYLNPYSIYHTKIRRNTLVLKI